MKKIYVIIIVVILFISIVALKILNTHNSYYLIFDNVAALEYKNGKFVEVGYEDLLDRTYSCFSLGEFIGYYNIYSRDENNEYYMTNKANEEAYTFEHPYLFVSSNVEVLEYKVEDGQEDDLSYLTYDLDMDFIESIDDLDTFKKVIFDIDGDMVDEYIYSASYFGIDDNNSFSIVFLVKDNKVYVMGQSSLFESYDEEDSFESIDNFELKYLIKIDDSIKMVVGMGSTDLTYYQIFSFDNDLIEEYGG